MFCFIQEKTSQLREFWRFANANLDKSEKETYGARAKVIAVILTAVYVILFFVDKHEIAIPIGVAFLVATILLFVGYIKEKNKNNAC